jgi:hypothetical protein
LKSGSLLRLRYDHPARWGNLSNVTFFANGIDPDFPVAWSDSVPKKPFRKAAIAA